MNKDVRILKEIQCTTVIRPSSHLIPHVSPCRDGRIHPGHSMMTSSYLSGTHVAFFLTASRRLLRVYTLTVHSFFFRLVQQHTLIRTDNGEDERGEGGEKEEDYRTCLLINSSCRPLVVMVIVRASIIMRCMNNQTRCELCFLIH